MIINRKWLASLRAFAIRDKVDADSVQWITIDGRPCDTSASAFPHKDPDACREALQRQLWKDIVVAQTSGVLISSPAAEAGLLIHHPASFSRSHDWISTASRLLAEGKDSRLWLCAQCNKTREPDTFLPISLAHHDSSASFQGPGMAIVSKSRMGIGFIPVCRSCFNEVNLRAAELESLLSRAKLPAALIMFICAIIVFPTTLILWGSVLQEQLPLGLVFAMLVAVSLVTGFFLNRRFLEPISARIKELRQSTWLSQFGAGVLHLHPIIDRWVEFMGIKQVNCTRALLVWKDGKLLFSMKCGLMDSPALRKLADKLRGNAGITPK